MAAQGPRLGRAWLDPDGEGGWRKRRGRTTEGWIDERTARVAAAEAIKTAAGEAAKAAAAAHAKLITVRRLAFEWLDWLEQVRVRHPSTLRDHWHLLREPGDAHKRETGTTSGRIMAAFGDTVAEELTPKAASAWLRQLDDEGLSPRNVNKHRQTMRAIFAYGQRPDTHAMPLNPFAATDKRREAPRATFDFYEATEVEALARACEAGAHRTVRGRANPDHRGPATPAPLSRAQKEAQAAERVARAAEDRQDADLFRVLFYSGVRLGEVLALRWDDVPFLVDMLGASLHVRRAVSAGVEKEPKGRKARRVPLPRTAAEALARVGARGDFTTPDDYVFCNRFDRRLDGEASDRATTEPSRRPACVTSSSTASATPPAPSSPARCRWSPSATSSATTTSRRRTATCTRRSMRRRWRR